MASRITRPFPRTFRWLAALRPRHSWLCAISRFRLFVIATSSLTPLESFGSFKACLMAPRHHRDVARNRSGGAPRVLLEVIVEQVRVQVLTSRVSIDHGAQSLDTSVRTLQRELNRGHRFSRIVERNKGSATH